MIEATIVTAIVRHLGLSHIEIYNRYSQYIPQPFKKKFPLRPHGILTLPLVPDSTELCQVVEELVSHGVDITLFRDVYYTPAEIKKIGFFRTAVPFPLELEGTTIYDYGTAWFGGCPHCGFGRLPIGDIIVDRKYVSKYRMGNLRGEIFVNEEVKNIIEANDLTGVCFERKVKDYKNRQMPVLYGMTIKNILPPMSEKTWLVPDSPLECGHEVIYLRSDIQYEEAKLESALDFNLSSEYIDNWRIPEIIVSKKVKEIFKENKIHARFQPITVLPTSNIGDSYLRAQGTDLCVDCL